MRAMVQHLIDDAADTTNRIRGEVAHLRDLGRQAKLAAKVATGVAKAKLEQIAAHVAKLEKVRGPRVRGSR